MLVEVAENHGLDDHRGAPFVGELLLAPIQAGLSRMPRFEDLLDGLTQLLQGGVGDIDPVVRQALPVGQGQFTHLLGAKADFLEDVVTPLVGFHEPVEKSG